jgi:drug/metabolite transporter (DMT)-like permease
MKQKIKGNLFLLFSVFIWGICIPLNKMVLGSVPSIMLIWIELFASVVFLLVFNLILKQKFRVHGRFLVIFLVGLLEPGVAYYLEFLGMEKTSALHASIILAFEPIGVIFFNIVLFNLNRDLRLILSNVFAVIGVLIVSFGSGNLAETTTILGDFIILIGTLAASLYVSITMRWSKDEELYTMIFFQQLSSLVFISFFITPSSEFLLASNLSASVIAASLGIGLFQFGIAFLCYFKGTQNGGDYESVIVLCLTPIIAIFFSILLLREIPNATYFIGSLVVFLSVIYAHSREKIIEK